MAPEIPFQDSEDSVKLIRPRYPEREDRVAESASFPRKGEKCGLGGFMEDLPRYIIGIDLGTTHTVVAYVDTDLKKNPSLATQIFKIPQLVDVGRVEAKPMLPSFHYLASTGEFPDNSLLLPWEKEGEKHFFVGFFAREQGAQVPTKIVQSAKSWLSNGTASRKDNILPFEAAEEARRISPVEASASYLAHIKEAWNATIAKGKSSDFLEHQEIVLTVPASFDEIARSLTLDAAKCAGFAHVTLVEEPQAAFYSWLMEHEKTWQEPFQGGEGILVCDVGGGTTDFTWIQATKNDQGIVFQRTAVGEHLLLGGDNMDVAIAHLLEEKFANEGFSLHPSQLLELRHQARLAKENLLGTSPPSTYQIWISGSGSQVVRGGRGTTLGQQEVEHLLVEGFFRLYPFAEAVQLNRASGLRTMGLPYERDPSVTKHLAAFLLKNSLKIKPSYVLFNGGALKNRHFQKRLLHSLDMWFPEQTKPVQELKIASLDLAVAKGAAYFGKSRRGLGVRIEGGASRGYYLGIDIKDAKGDMEHCALTLLPKGAMEGIKYVSDHLFLLLPNTPVLFQLYYSNTRLGDAKGSLVPIQNEEMTPLPPLRTLLRFGSKHEDKIPVRVGVHLTEVGTLELWLESTQTSHRWELEFQLRSTLSGDLLPSQEEFFEGATLDQELLSQLKNEMVDSLSLGNVEKLHSLMSSLEKIVKVGRQQWPLSMLRGLFDTLLKHASKREVSPFYEGRFWNLAGFFLRPGCGYPLDDHRIKDIWKVILHDFNKSKSEDVQIQQWICFRRIAGGLSRGQQAHLFHALLPTMLLSKAEKREYAYAEKLRALASLELVEIPLKVKLGKALLKKIHEKQGVSHDFWALGRLGARQLMWGKAGDVIPRPICEEWVRELIKVRGADPLHLGFALSLLAQKTDMREINLSEPVMKEVLEYLKQFPDQEVLRSRMMETAPFTHKEKERVFGDSLPIGLSLSSNG